MDKKVFIGVAVVALVVVCVVLTAGCTEKANYIVGVDAEYPPYSYVDEAGNYVGFDVESIKWIAEQGGFTVEIKGVAWDGIIEALKVGQIDMVYSGMTITPDRAAEADFSIPYWKVNQGLVAKAGSDYTVDEFKNGALVIGVQRSCSADQWMQDTFGKEQYDKMVKDGVIKLFDSFPMSMVALNNGQVQVVIFDDVNIESYIRGKDEFKLVGIIETGEEYGVAIRKGDSAMKKLIDDGLTKLMASEKWNELKEKYIVEN